MKICHLTSVHSYKDTRIFLKECCSLAQVGIDVHLIAINAPNKNINGVQVHGIKFQPKNRLDRIKNSGNLVYKKALEVNADIYHFHDPELIPVGLKLKKHGKKVIYDVHEDVPRQILSKHWIPKPLRKVISSFFEKYENRSSKKFDGIVTATPFINKRFEKLGCNAVNINNYPILHELHVKDMDWNSKERAVCYVGGISKIRGIFEMIDAIANTDVRLLLGGKFANSVERDEVIKDTGWNQVDELGFLNREEVSQVMNRSMAGLVTLHPTINYLDALPVKMFEYMAAGLPVIASNFPLWKEIIEGNQCGLCVDPLNPNEIAKAIQWIVDHPNEAKKMGDNGRRAVEEKYNWENESIKLKQLYDQLQV